jgi:hypothetical protein
VGAACQAAVAIAFGVPVHSTRLIEHRCGFYARDGVAPDARVQDTNGTFRSWTTYGVKPSAPSIEKVWRASGHTLDLSGWVEHPLFRLLRARAPDLGWLKATLQQQRPRIREILLIEQDDQGLCDYPLPDRDMVLALRDLYRLEALVSLLCWARIAEHLEIFQVRAMTALAAYDMLPRVLANEPVLQYRWENLVDCVAARLWTTPCLGGIRLPIDLSALKTRVEQAIADPDTRYPLLMGRRLTVKEQHARERMLRRHERKRALADARLARSHV